MTEAVASPPPGTSLATGPARESQLAHIAAGAGPTMLFRSENQPEAIRRALARRLQTSL